MIGRKEHVDGFFKWTLYLFCSLRIKKKGLWKYFCTREKDQGSTMVFPAKLKN